MSVGNKERKKQGKKEYKKKSTPFNLIIITLQEFIRFLFNVVYHLQKVSLRFNIWFGLEALNV